MEEAAQILEIETFIPLMLQVSWRSVFMYTVYVAVVLTYICFNLLEACWHMILFVCS